MLHLAPVVSCGPLHCVMERWVGKTAIVTGASAGIGAAIAVSLANAGLNVVGLARRPHLIEALKSKVKPATGQLVAKKCDISLRQEVTTVFATVNQAFGGIHIVVNNAAYLKNGTLTDVSDCTVSDEDIEGIIKTNLTGVVTCCREAVKYMKQTGEQGHIVNISSVAGHYVPAALGIPSLNIYYGTKHALRATCEAMRLEFSNTKTNIKITSISPALVQTDIFETAGLGEVMAGAPRLEPGDIADAVLAAVATPPRVNISDVVIRPMGDTF